MAYDDSIATRVRRALSDRRDVVEKLMFGGLTFMVAGNMCCGVNRDDLILRLDPKTTLEDLNSQHVRLWDFMKRPMPGMFAVTAAGCTRQEMVDRWVKLALAQALSIPPKAPRAAKPRRRSG